MKVYHERGGFGLTECLNTPTPTITATQCRMYVVNDGKAERERERVD
jgi:hypothetical protein